MKKKILLASIIALSLALLVAVGGSIAWLIADANEIENVFSPSDIEITLTETMNVENDSSHDGPDAWMKQMIPGNSIDKNPAVTVTSKTNIPVWLFVKVTESDNLDDYIEYTIADGWKLYPSGNIDTTATGAQEYVIYREVSVAEIGTEYKILANDKVTVKNTVTKQMMNSLTAQNVYPTLTFDAAAVQMDNLTLEAAYAQAWSTTNP